MEASTPPVNVYEGNGQLSVATPLPGARPDQVQVVVSPTAVRIAAIGKYPQDSQHYHLHEWQVSAWERAVTLPKRVDPGASRATLNRGVLVVMAPISPTGDGESRPQVE
jgi:HSP20 family molecular chaperone IbpA